MTTREQAIAGAGQVLANARVRIEGDLASGGPAAVARAAFIPGGPSVEELTRRAEARFGGAAEDAA